MRLPVIFRAAAIGLAVCAPAQAQQSQIPTSTGTGATFRVLDKITVEVTDVELATGASEQIGMLTIRAGECRYPQGDPARDAFAYVTITDELEGAAVFEGWMIGSSPALNPLEHARYDVWVLRCNTA